MYSELLILALLIIVIIQCAPVPDIVNDDEISKLVHFERESEVIPRYDDDDDTCFFFRHNCGKITTRKIANGDSSEESSYTVPETQREVPPPIAEKIVASHYDDRVVQHVSRQRDEDDIFLPIRDVAHPNEYDYPNKELAATQFDAIFHPAKYDENYANNNNNDIHDY